MKKMKERMKNIKILKCHLYVKSLSFKSKSLPNARITDSLTGLGRYAKVLGAFVLIPLV